MTAGAPASARKELMTEVQQKAFNYLLEAKQTKEAFELGYKFGKSGIDIADEVLDAIKALLTPESTIAQTYQWLWDIREREGPKTLDALLAKVYKYDKNTVMVIGSNPLLREESIDGTRPNIARAPLDHAALLFLCEITKAVGSVYYAPAKLHLESGKINRYSTKTNIKKIVGFVSDRKVATTK